MARPKLKAGEKGRYNLSRTEKRKREVRKELKAAKDKQRSIEKKAQYHTENTHQTEEWAEISWFWWSNNKRIY